MHALLLASRAHECATSSPLSQRTMLARSTLCGGTLAVDGLARARRDARCAAWRTPRVARPRRAPSPRAPSFLARRCSSIAVPTFCARSSRPASVVTRAVGDDRTAASRARLDAIREEDEGDVEDPGERGSVDMFSGLNLTPETLAYWESQNAFFFPRLLLVGMTALGLAALHPPEPSADSSAATTTPSPSSPPTSSSSSSPPASPRST